ncbi:hypothetical protein ACQPYK_49020 (plasmid) [Streptosporangium sp. CA-135522]|uniref:hypothetical protein n=1 Tax=Streptosporangium sp. CA-135522 TaxID=3240072 RepID=UPI003D948D94
MPAVPFFLGPYYVDNVDSAFGEAVNASRLFLGSGGITDKDDYVVIGGKPRSLEAAQELAAKLSTTDPAVSDVHGPAAAIEIEGGGWVFCGVAT